MQRFRELVALLEKDPAAYREEVARLKRDEPERFDALTEALRQAVEAATSADDRPLTPEETSELVDATARELGWSRDRVIADGVMRLRLALRVDGEHFRPVTPEPHDKRKPGTYVRRKASMEAILVGDVHALLEEKKRARKK